MIILETVAVAFSMFSAIPMPHVDWNEKNMRYSLCAFPLIGLVTGIAMWLWQRVCFQCDLPDLLRGAGLCLLPVMLTGGIHLDGYADTWDALASHGGQDQKQQILKDPHIGTFAVVRLCMYFVAELALWTASGPVRFPVLTGLFMLSRSLSGLALTVFPLREGSGLARSFAEASDRKRVRTLLLVLSVLLALLLSLNGAWEAVPAAAGVGLVYYRMCVKTFGGLSGDLAGWFLQTAELWMLAALLLRQLIG